MFITMIPGDAEVNKLPANAGDSDQEDPLENAIDWWITVYVVAKNRTQLSK